MMGAKKGVHDEIVTKNKVIAKCTYNKKRKVNTTFLPSEIIFHILVWLPADILYNTMRFVCKQWYEIVKDPRFVGKQVLVCSNMGLCFQCCQEKIVYFAQFGKKTGSLSKLATLPSIPMYSRLFTCNGLVLFRSEMKGPVHIANPLTKQMLTLPLLDRVSNSYIVNACPPTYSIGCSTSNSPLLESKIVFTGQCQYGSFRYGVFTLGKDDQWRITDSRSLFLRDEDRLFVKEPCVAGKYLHWVSPGSSYVVSMDMVSEKLYFSPTAPNAEKYGTQINVGYVVRRDSLTCMIGFYDNTLLWEVWELADIVDGGATWNKICDIDFRPQKRRLKSMVEQLFRKPINYYSRIEPVAWINNGEAVVFKPRQMILPFIVYNIKTKYFFQLRCHVDHGCFGFQCSYAPSLLSLN